MPCDNNKFIQTSANTTLDGLVYESALRIADCSLYLKKYNKNHQYYMDHDQSIGQITSFPLGNMSQEDLINALRCVGVPDDCYIIADRNLEIIDTHSDLRAVDNYKISDAVISLHDLYYKNIHIANSTEITTRKSDQWKCTIYTLPLNNSPQNNFIWLTNQNIQDIIAASLKPKEPRFWGFMSDESKQLLAKLKDKYMTLENKQAVIENYLADESNEKRRLYNIINTVIPNAHRNTVIECRSRSY